jgi:hypothetical protein
MADFEARSEALQQAVAFMKCELEVENPGEAIVTMAGQFAQFLGERPAPQPQGKVTFVAYVIVDGQNPSGARMYFNGYAGGQPAWASHIAQAIRFSREKDAAALIDTLDGHVCHVEEQEFDAWDS